MATARICFLFTLCFVFVSSLNLKNDQEDVPLENQKKVSEQILVILHHYKQEDPVGLPGAPIPDPLTVPPFAHSFSIGKMGFSNVKIFGLKQFRINQAKADLAEMKVEASLTIDVIDVFGNYTLTTWLSRAAGPFTVTMKDLHVKAIATLDVERTGLLEAQEISMDITFKSIAMDFKNLGFFASMFQGVLNSVGTAIFDSIKPFILSEVNNNIRNDVNKQVRKIPQKFPNSISPFDQAIAQVRQHIRNLRYDPYLVADYNNSVGVFDVYMTHTWLYGLSSIHRVGEVQFQMENGSVYALAEVGTQQLKGTSNWELALIAGIISKTGTVTFTVEYFKVKVYLSQSVKTETPPRLEDIQLEMGNIQVRFDGAGTLDYAVELGVNVLPNLLRYQIMDALESPIKLRVQEALNTVNIERIIKENADRIDNADSAQFL